MISEKLMDVLKALRQGEIRIYCNLPTFAHTQLTTRKKNVCRAYITCEH
jgi:hypothetical protein